MDFSQFGPVALAVAAVAFFAGGTVKGVTGIGLPLVAVPVLASTLDPRVAVAMMTVPVLTSNLWMIFREGRLRATLRRFWSLLLTLAGVTVLSAQLLVEIDAATASLLLGLVVVGFCAMQLFPLDLRVSRAAERWLSPVIGAVAGLMGGISNFFGPPVIAWLIALRLEKNAFVAAVSLFFIVGGVPLYGSLAWHGVLTTGVLAASAAAAVVVFAGVAFGTRLRRIVRQETFQRILIGALFLIGLNLIRRGFA